MYFQPGLAPVIRGQLLGIYNQILTLHCYSNYTNECMWVKLLILHVSFVMIFLNQSGISGPRLYVSQFCCCTADC